MLCRLTCGAEVQLQVRDWCEHTVRAIVLEIGTGGSVSLISKEAGHFFLAPLRGAAETGSISKVSQFLRSPFSVSISKT